MAKKGTGWVRETAAYAAVLFVCSILLISTAGGEQSATTDSPATHTLELAPGVHVVLRPHAGRFDDANSGLIATEAGAIVIDAPSDAETAGRFFDAVQAEAIEAAWREE